jgi:hypothetical protein
MSNGRRQPSCGGTSRMTRECQVRFCERLGVRFPGPTRHQRSSNDVCVTSAITPTAARMRTLRVFAFVPLATETPTRHAGPQPFGTRKPFCACRLLISSTSLKIPSFRV